LQIDVLRWPICKSHIGHLGTLIWLSERFWEPPVPAAGHEFPSGSPVACGGLA
jgi:hypothetical protein